MNKSLAIYDYRMDNKMVAVLSEFYNTVSFSAKNMVVNPLDGHPDLFISQFYDSFIVSKNCPEEVIKKIDKNKVNYCFGYSYTGFDYPEIARYNVVVSDNFLLCNSKYCDSLILEKAVEKLIVIHVNQSFCRCSTIALKNDLFLTSDEGIYKTLTNNNIRCYYFDDANIKIEGYSHGLFGGCFGIDNINNLIIATGSIKMNNKLVDIIEKSGYSILELSTNRLTDVGGIFIINSKK